MSARCRAILAVNVAVLLFGLVGPLAKEIRLGALDLTFWRVVMSSSALGIFLLARRRSIRVSSRRDVLSIIVAGVVLAVHWWTFIGAIQVSTVAIGTITFASFPLFLTFLEPLAFGGGLRAGDVLVALVILVGVSITVPELSLEDSTTLGVVIGMTSTFLYAVLALFNKVLSARLGSVLTAFWEQVVATALLAPFVLSSGAWPEAGDVVPLLVLGVVTTAVAHTMFISGLSGLPAHLAGVLSSMETVYGIIMAMLILGERPALREWIGAIIVVGTVVFANLRSHRDETGGAPAEAPVVTPSID